MPPAWLGQSKGDCENICVRANGQRAYFAIDIREDASGREIWVPTRTFGLPACPGGENGCDECADHSLRVKVEAITRNQYRWHRLVRTRWGRIEFAGLILSTIGLLITAPWIVGAVCDACVVVRVHPDRVGALSSLGTSLLAVGAAIVAGVHAWAHR